MSDEVKYLPICHTKDVVGLVDGRAPGDGPDGARPLDPHLLVAGLVADRHDAVAQTQRDVL